MAIWTQHAVDALATAVSDRRRHLGRSQIEVWQNGGPANSTMTSLEAAASLSVTPATLRKLDAGLVWTPDTAAKVIRGDITPSAAVRDPRFDARLDGASGAIALELIGLADGDVATLVSALAVDADDIRLATRAIDTGVDTEDPQAVQAVLSKVEDAIGDIDDFVDAVDDLARRVFGGDAELLRRSKREMKRLRRQLAAPAVEVLHAARTAPPGYTAGRSGQGEADGEETQVE